jgi:hypothetical protein
MFVAGGSAMNALNMVNLGGSLRITIVVVPVAAYFLILGLLNSRRRPQLLSGRLDFALLVLPLSPLLLLPVMEYLGPAALLMGAGVLAAGGMLLLPGRADWVIYNMPVEAGRRAVRRAFERAGGEVRTDGDDLELTCGDARVEVSSFPLLRNLSVKLRSADEPLARRFEAALAGEVGSAPAETSPTAVALLLVATGMLVMPLTLIAPQAGEIVRLLTDLLP